jgi:mono/diheme cytochrome c family protein
MSRTTLNLVIDLSTAALFAGLVATGYVLGFAIPPGTNRSLMLWGMTRHRWGDVHFWISLAFLAAVLVHVCLHWRWVVATLGKRLGVSRPRPARSALATGLAVAALAGLLGWLTNAGVREVADPAAADVGPRPAGNGYETEATPGPAGPARPVDFWGEVAPVLERSCVGCHGPKRAKAGFRADRREDFFGGKDGPLVLPGDAARSPLIGIVTGTRPDLARPDCHKLPGPEAALLRAWIECGAPWPDRPGR